MIKTYNQRFYPNPFRYRKLKTLLDQSEILEHVQEKLRPFLYNRFSEIQSYIDELGELKPGFKIIRVLHQKLNDKYDSIFTKSNSFSRVIRQQIENNNKIEHYQKNLRYLELPLQPTVDKHGFEIQLLSSDLFEEALEEVESGYNFIYEYCANAFPESIELWEDHVLWTTVKESPFIFHDDILESTYEIFDKIFDDFQKGSISLFNWVVSGDLNSRLLTVVKPNIKLTKVNYLFYILKSVIALILLVLILRYFILKVKPLLNFKNKHFPNLNRRAIFVGIKKEILYIKKDFAYKKIILNQKTKNLKLQLKKFNLKINLKYKLLKLILKT